MIVVALVQVADSEHAEFRVDTFDKDGRRTGYVTIDPRSGRIEQFDTRSNRLGHGQASPSGRVDLFDKNSNRTGYGTITSPGRNGSTKP